MKLRRLVLVLSVINLGLLVFLLGALKQTRPALADDPAPVLRGRSLEIVDGKGRARATLAVLPAVPKAADGKAYPETVILRLIDPEGQPSVKISASKDGSGIGLVNGADNAYIILKAEGREALVKLVNKDRQKLIEP